MFRVATAISAQCVKGNCFKGYEHANGNGDFTKECGKMVNLMVMEFLLKMR